MTLLNPVIYCADPILYEHLLQELQRLDCNVVLVHDSDLTAYQMWLNQKGDEAELYYDQWKSLLLNTVLSFKHREGRLWDDHAFLAVIEQHPKGCKVYIQRDAYEWENINVDVLPLWLDRLLGESYSIDLLNWLDAHPFFKRWLHAHGKDYKYSYNAIEDLYNHVVRINERMELRRRYTLLDTETRDKLDGN